jgi:subfamily B ATP-binding cassette protein MsbA
MDPYLIDADDQQRARSRSFHWRELKRLVKLTWPFRRTLFVGFAFALVFVILHTVSIAGVFPILKVLLDQEGITGWLDRTAAGMRVDAEFSQVEEDGAIRVLHSGKTGALADSGIEAFDTLTFADAAAARDWLTRIAGAEAGTVVSTTALRGAETISIAVSLPEAPRETRWLLRAQNLLPAQADTRKLRTLTLILGFLVLIVILANVCRFVGEVLVATGVLRAMVSLRAHLYERVLLLPMAFFSVQSTSDVVTRFVQDVQEIQRGLLALFGKFLREPLKAAFILGLAFVLDWRITLTMIVVAPVVVVIFWAVGRSVKKANLRLLRAYGTMIDALSTSLQNLRVVKAYTAEPQERDRLKQIDRNVLRQQIKLARMEAFLSPMLETIAVVAGCGVTVWLAAQVLSQELSLAKFVQLGFTLSMLFDPLRKLSDLYVRLQRSTAGAQRIFQVLDQPGEEEAITDAPKLAPLRERIEFDRVTFTYPGAEVPALKDVSLVVNQGESVAVVGPNGSGKTTLMSLLLRFFDPQEGAIRYDGMDLREASLRSLRQQISLVTQEAVVFAGTPRENITYGAFEDGKFIASIASGAPGAPDAGGVVQGGSGAGHQTALAADGTGAAVLAARATEDAVVEAARQAFADEFIRGLPGGYESRLGERGSTLSGGQRQRLAIARAIYRDAPILIFDEATSQIDSESELQIQQALRAYAKDHTTFIIAHRLSTIQFAQRIVVMERGAIVDAGTHEELFERCPLYRTLCETQLVGSRPQ